jgi:hypothetical protein
MKIFIDRKINKPIVQRKLFDKGFTWWASKDTDIKSVSTNLIVETDMNSDEYGIASSDKDYGNCDVKCDTIESLVRVIEIDFSNTIDFDDLMKRVQYSHKIINAPYVLDFENKQYCFKDSNEVIPYVEGELGILVTYGDR